MTDRTPPTYPRALTAAGRQLVSDYTAGIGIQSPWDFERRVVATESEAIAMAHEAAREAAAARSETAPPDLAAVLLTASATYRRVVERRYHGQATWAAVADADAALAAAERRLAEAPGWDSTPYAPPAADR